MPAGETYIPIASTTLGSDTSSVTFSSITGSYTDLVLVIGGFLGSPANSETIKFQCNGDTGSNYSSVYMYVTAGGSIVSTSESNQAQAACGRMGGTNYGGTVIAHFNNYANTTTYKTILGRGNETNVVWFSAGMWRSTSAITSIKVYPELYGSGTNFKSGTVFTLYGILAA